MVGEVAYHEMGFFSLFSNVSSCDIRVEFHVLRKWEVSNCRLSVANASSGLFQLYASFLRIVRAVKENLMVRMMKAGGFAYVCDGADKPWWRVYILSPFSCFVLFFIFYMKAGVTRGEIKSSFIFSWIFRSKTSEPSLVFTY